MMEASEAAPSTEKHVYSVWALPPDDVAERLKRKVMEPLRSEFGGPQFEPHITVVGAISLTAEEALEKFRSACDGVRAHNVAVDRVATGTFFYQCVYLLIQPSDELIGASSHCSEHFGYKSETPYMPHLSLLYADLSDDEKKKALEKANSLDVRVGRLCFPINRLVLYKTDTEDKTLKSWEKVAECDLKAKSDPLN
jgi:2'-5' RNA ligase